MHHLQIFSLGISVSLPSHELEFISECVCTWEAGSLEGFQFNQVCFFSHLVASSSPNKGSDTSFELWFNLEKRN